jgi:hypothetical protein
MQLTHPSQLVPVGYGVSKLQINLVIEDEKISLDELQDEIAEHEDYVQVRRSLLAVYFADLACSPATSKRTSCRLPSRISNLSDRMQKL